MSSAAHPQGGPRATALRKRAETPSRIFLTGGTGFLGSHVAAALLRRGHSVTILARPRNGLGPERRLKALLDWFGLAADERLGLRVVPGDVTWPALGLDPDVHRELVHATDEVVHCASSTSFTESRRSEVEKVNIEGLARVLEFARSGRVRVFHHVSTAFVAGRVNGLCLEKPAAGPAFHNAYEETKCLGEAMAAEACRQAGMGLTVYRPSIVYGDSRTGRSLLFNALYYPVRTALFLKDLFEKDIRERGGLKAAELGVTIQPDGRTRLPIRIEVSGEGGLNLVPVDFFVQAFLAIRDGAPDGGIFHIINDKVKRIEEIVDYSCRLFRMTGIRTCSGAEFAAIPKTGLELLFDRYLEAYGPYMRDVRVFDTSRAGPLLAERGLACPDLDFEVFSRCLTFAVGCGWGARLFEA